jgi:uncharacterized phage-like protein YoqJ
MASTAGVRALCVTGPRKDFIPIVVHDSLQEAVFTAYIKGFTVFITGMALGVDTIFAEIVLNLRETFGDMELHAYIPFEGQELKWKQPQQQHYCEILAECNDVVHCSEAGFQPKKFQIRNEAMVDESDAIVAVYDGREGGTKNCFDYAWKKKKPIRVIDPRTGQAKWLKKR